MKFSENLISLRKKKGLSQEQLADELGITRQTISKWELGVSTPEMDKLVQIANYFDVNVDDLISKENINNKKQTNSSFVGVDEKYIPQTNASDNTYVKKDKNATRQSWIIIILIFATFICVFIFSFCVMFGFFNIFKPFKGLIPNFDKVMNSFYEQESEQNEKYNELVNQITEKHNELVNQDNEKYNEQVNQSTEKYNEQVTQMQNTFQKQKQQLGF